MSKMHGPQHIDIFSASHSYGSDIAADAFFLAIITLSLLSCLGITVYTRRCLPFSLVLCTTYILEIVSHAQRLQSWSMSNYIADVVLSTLAPVFLTIGIHICSAKVIHVLGEEHAMFKPNRHLRIFIWTDIFAGILQATGLAIVFANAKAIGHNAIQLSTLATTGQYTVCAGLLIQAIFLLAALGLLASTYLKAGKSNRQYGYTTFHKDAGYVPLSPRFKTFLVILPLAGICILIRTAYRAVSFFDGLDGRLATNETAFVGAEGVMLTEAMVSLALFHPAVWLDDGKDRGIYHSRNPELRKRQSRDAEETLDEVSRLILKTNLIPLSDASVSDGGSSRRGSETTESRHSENITETAHVMDEEDDRLEVESIVLPARNPSTRTEGLERSDTLGSESVYSIVLPARNPSGNVAGEGVERSDTLSSQSVYSQY